MLTGRNFSSFSQASNLGIVDISAIKDSEILNTVTNQLKQASSGLKDMASNLIQGLLPFDSTQASSVIDGHLRSVKDAFSTLQDVTGLSPQQLEAQIADLLPGDKPMQAAFRSLAATCRDPAMSKRPGFKNFADKFGCGNNSGRCSSGQVSGLLGQITGGAIGAIGRAMQSILNSLVTLANLGYSGGLCKIFSALATSLGATGGVLQRASAAVLASVGSEGNMTGVFDVVSGMGKSIPSAEIPGLVSIISENFKVPANFQGDQFSSLYEGATDAYSAIQPGFDRSSQGDMASVASMGDFNSALGSAAQAFLSSKSPGDNFSSPVFESGFDTAVAYAGKSALSSISSFFG